MKTILFFWLLMLPIKMFAQAPVDNLLEERQRLFYQLRQESNSQPTVFGISMKSSPSAEYQLAMRIIEKDNAIIKKLQLQDKIEQSSVISENEQYKSITLSQEQDIQKLKNALAQKGYEAQASLLEKRKFELATLIFFIGMITFGWLFVKDKLSFERPKILSFIPIHSEKE